MSSAPSNPASMCQIGNPINLAGTSSGWTWNCDGNYGPMAACYAVAQTSVAARITCYDDIYGPYSENHTCEGTVNQYLHGYYVTKILARAYQLEDRAPRSFISLAFAGAINMSGKVSVIKIYNSNKTLSRTITSLSCGDGACSYGYDNAGYMLDQYDGQTIYIDFN